MGISPAFPNPHWKYVPVSGRRLAVRTELVVVHIPKLNERLDIDESIPEPVASRWESDTRLPLPADDSPCG